MAKLRKKKFDVEENETIDQCLQRMEEEGYIPVRRFEEPVFIEEQQNGKTEVVHLRQKIVFEGKIK